MGKIQLLLTGTELCRDRHEQLMFCLVPTAYLLTGMLSNKMKGLQNFAAKHRRYHHVINGLLG
jgi:hypothetical protein